MDTKIEKEKMKCPECHHVFKGNGWDGIDAHWRAKHEHIIPYEEAWPLIKSGTYESKLVDITSTDGGTDCR